MEHDGLRLGMFLGGLLVAMVPTLLLLGVGVYVLKRYLEERRSASGSTEDGSAP